MANVLNQSTQSIIRPVHRPVLGSVAQSIILPRNLESPGGAPYAGTLLNGLVSWYPLNETDGTRYDSHGSTDLTDGNTVTQAAGKVGSSAQFTAANLEYLTAAHPHGMHGGKRDWSIAMWLYADSLTGNLMAAACGGVSGSGTTLNWAFQIESGTIKFYVGVGTTPLIAVPSTFGALSVDTWYLAIASHEETADEITISINNGSVDTATANITSNSDEPFYIGRWGNGAGRYFPGRIDEFAFWSRLLTVPEKTELWNDAAGMAYPG